MSYEQLVKTFPNNSGKELVEMKAIQERAVKQQEIAHEESLKAMVKDINRNPLYFEYGRVNYTSFVKISNARIDKDGQVRVDKMEVVVDCESRMYVYVEVENNFHFKFFPMHHYYAIKKKEFNSVLKRVEALKGFTSPN